MSVATFVIATALVAIAGFATQRGTICAVQAGRDAVERRSWARFVSLENSPGVGGYSVKLRSVVRIRCLYENLTETKPAVKNAADPSALVMKGGRVPTSTLPGNPHDVIAIATRSLAADFASMAGCGVWPRCAVTIAPSLSRSSCRASVAGSGAPALLASSLT